MGSGLPVGHPKYKPFVVDVENALATFGDVNFIDHGGQLLVRDADGDPYLEVIEPPNENERQVWTIYRVGVERFQTVEQDRQVYLVGEAWRPDWPGALSTRDEWFHKHLDSIADHEGVELQELRGWFCSEDPKDRARGYLAVAAVHGWVEFDQYPLELSEFEVHQRYGEEPPAMKIKLDNLDHDDGMVTVYCEDRQAAIHDQSINGSNWEAPEDLTAAYAVIGDDPDLVDQLEGEGYEVDASDYCPP